MFHWGGSSSGLLQFSGTTGASFGALTDALPVKSKRDTFDIALTSEATSLQKRSGMARVVEGFHSSTPVTHAFVHERNEPYLSLPSQPKLVLIY